MRVLWLLVLPVVVASNVSCLGTIRAITGMKPDQVAPLADTQTSRNGVCAFIDTSKFLGPSSISIQTCARMIQSEAGDAEPTALLNTEFCSSDAERSNPGNWKLEITSEDGRVLVERTYEKLPELSDISKVHYFLFAGSDSCHRSDTSDTLPEPWKVGTYRLRYTYLPDNELVEMTITLQ